MHARGWKSTKLHLALITMALITLVYALTGFPPVSFGEYCMALIAAAGIYSGSATVEKFASRPSAISAALPVSNPMPPQGGPGISPRPSPPV